MSSLFEGAGTAPAVTEGVRQACIARPSSEFVQNFGLLIYRPIHQKDCAPSARKGTQPASYVLFLNEILGNLDDVIRAEAELAQHFPRRAGMAEFVVHADAAHRRRALLRQHRRDGLAQTADDAVLLAGDDLAAGLRRLDDDFLVERLDECRC